MAITRSGMAALIALCGAAGAGGAYLATRINSVPTSATQSTEPAQVFEIGSPAPPRSDTGSAVGRRNQVAPATATRETLNAAAASSGRDPAPAPPAPLPAEPAAILQSNASTSDAGTSASSSASAETEGVRPTEEALTNAPEPEFVELVVPSDAVLGLQVDTTISSESARVEDQVTAHVTRDVRIGDRTAIPSGAKAFGVVTLVERGGRLRERARLGVRFSSLLLTDGSRVPISTDVVFRDGDSPSRESAAKIGGGAIGGAIIGGILGGGKGAVLGGTAGAGAGTAIVMAGGRNAATLLAGSPLTVRLTRPMAITVDR